MTTALRSAIYVGRLRHRRYEPRLHTFSYRLFMMYLDLDELPRLLALPWVRRYARAGVIGFRRADYLGDPGVPLAEAVRAVLARRIGLRSTGPIRLLSHFRQFGYCFNPVSFYYCFDHAERLEAVVAEVTNTPWGERHAYVLDAAHNLGTSAKQRYRFRKAFHVSPFMAMNFAYDWRLTVPGPALLAHMENHTPAGRSFDATLALRRRELSGAALARTLAGHPFMPVRVAGAIYLQAARLWLKRIPFVPHPRRAG
jgi:DUF1365 family protein